MAHARPPVAASSDSLVQADRGRQRHAATGSRWLRRLRHDPVTLVCAGVLLLIVLAAIFAPLTRAVRSLQGVDVRRLKPLGSRGHLLGTDELGRDMLTPPDLWRAAVAVDGRGAGRDRLG